MMPAMRSMAMKVTISALISLIGVTTFAGTLIELDGGSQMESETLLKDGDVLVYIERDCAVCRRYVQDLASCPTRVQKKIKLVSISTAAQTKEMARKFATDLPIFLAKEGSESVSATPTTQTAHTKTIGRLSCNDLSVLLTNDRIDINN